VRNRRFGRRLDWCRALRPSFSRFEMLPHSQEEISFTVEVDIYLDQDIEGSGGYTCLGWIIAPNI
jgi:hypothetical protein